MVKPRMTLTVQLALGALLAEPERELYGLEILHATGFASGTVYPILRRLEAAGWVSSRMEVIDAHAEGRPPRRYYRLTEDGVREAREAMQATARFHHERTDRCHHRDCHGLSCDEYDALRARAAGRCEICGIAEAETKRGMLVIDHFEDSEVRYVRGLVCDPCNAVMSCFDGRKPWGANRAWEPKAAEYAARSFKEPAARRSRTVLVTYRVDADLLAAVAAKAASRGETVTDVIRRAFEAFLADDAPAPVKRSRPAPVPPSADPRVSAGTATAVFQPAGAEPVVTHPVPAKTADEAREQLDRAVARKSAAKGQCEHRVKSGSYCKECGRLI